MPARPAPYWRGNWLTKHNASSGVSAVTGTDQIVHMIKNIAIIGGLITFSSL